MPMKTGEFFKTYYLIDRIGHGGMSVVHLAFDVKSKKFVALKTLFSDLSSEVDYRNRFEREIRVYRKLNHPNIVSLMESELNDSVAYMAQEYVNGQSLGKLIEIYGDQFPLPEAMKIMEGLTNAIFHAHSRGVIHRDIQPNNIIIDNDGTVKLLDFGIAYTEDSLVQTQTGTIMGTFVYCSPEQNQGKRVDERSDLYSLGLIFYEMLSGRRAIKGESLMEITEYQLRQSIPPLKQLRFEVPDALNDIIMNLLERWPENRFRYARNLIDELIQMKVTSPLDDLDTMFGDESAVMRETAKKAYQNRRYAKSLELLKTLSSKDPEDGATQFLLGKVLQAMGDGEEAASAFERAIEIVEDESEYRMEYALCLYRIGQEEEAIAQCDILLASEEDNLMAKGLRGMLLGLKRGGLKIDPVSHKLSPASPLSIASGHENCSPLDEGLDLVERYGILNHRLDELDADVAQLLSSVFCGLGDFYNGAVREGVKQVSMAILLLLLALLLLFIEPAMNVDVYGFIEKNCYSELPERARKEHLQEKVNYALTNYLRIGLRFSSLPVIGLFVYLWTMNRQRVVGFHRRRYLYGRVSSTYRTDLFEIQVPSHPAVKEGEAFTIVENDPFTAGRSRRKVLGEAKVLLAGQTWAVCSFAPLGERSAPPSAGDLALPSDILQATVLPSDGLYEQHEALLDIARWYWSKHSHLISRRPSNG